MDLDPPDLGGFGRQMDRTTASSQYEIDGEEQLTTASEMDTDGDFEPPLAQHLIQPRPRRPRARHNRMAPVAVETALATIQLSREIEELRRRRDELMAIHAARVLNSARRDMSLNTVIEYFDTFRNGFSGPRLPEMLEYFDTRLDRDVFEYGSPVFGLDTWIEQWRRYMRLFPALRIRLLGARTTREFDSPDQLSIAQSDPTMTTSIIETQSSLGGILTRQAIYTLFPHLRHREDLVVKLEGKTCDLPMMLRFYFNSSGRVHRLDFDADFVQAVNNIQGISLMDLVQITERVEVGENSTVADVVELDDGPDRSMSTR